MTKQRKLISQILQDHAGHLSADEIYTYAKSQMPTIALGTVYRNLNLLVASGELLRIESPGLAERFDKKLTPHEHLRCVSCGKIEDVKISGLSEYIAKKIPNEEILECRLSLGYLCEECRKPL